MKSFKIVLIACFASIQFPLFGMYFLDPILQETIKNEEKFELYFNSNFGCCKKLSKIPKKPTAVPSTCAVCKEAIKLKRDWIKIKPCNDIVHKECMINWATNSWHVVFNKASELCPVCFEPFALQTMKLNENKKKAIFAIMESSGNRTIPCYIPENSMTLGKKSLITMLSVFALLASQSKLPWYVHKVTPFPIDWFEKKYGLASSAFTRSSKFHIQYSGKLLYMFVSDIIPSYLINKKLKQHLWNYIVDAYSTRNNPNSLPTL